MLTGWMVSLAGRPSGQDVPPGPSQGGKLSLVLLVLKVLFAAGVAVSTAVCAQAANVKVFILSGQSNMVGWANVRTIDHLGKDPKYGKLLKTLKTRRGEWVERDDVFIYSNVDDQLKQGQLSVGYGGGGAEWIGPEFMLGVQLGDQFEEPVLLIKAAWGGKDLYCDFRPPSAGPAAYTIPSRDGRERDQGAYYRKLIEEVHKSLDNLGRDFPRLKSRKIELCGFIWLQGWNEMFADQSIQTEVYEEYPSNFAHLVEDLRREFKAPELPVVIGELGVNGEQADDRIRQMRAAQSKIPEQHGLRGSSVFVRTAQYWDPDVDAAFRSRNEVSAALYSQLEPGIKRKLSRALRGKDEEQCEQNKCFFHVTNQALEQTKQYQAANERWLEVGSHWECHYHGSGKIYCLIGLGLAEGMQGLLKQ